MAPDIGRLGVDDGAAQSALSEALAAVGTRRAEVAAAAPRRTAASYGRGLAERAARLVELRERAHRVRLAHIDRLRRGLETAAGTVSAVSTAEGDSQRGFGAGEKQ
ncbi:hypothetical protein ACT3SZ_00115 [Corynebacterium sp. AOP40-9SA-29]|uniref:hypothetical protein n=1 Tax=Corynebacterium sp. AOP40-9SA-29 TaxID=3457677 RepID=UPI0040339FEC